MHARKKKRCLPSAYSVPFRLGTQTFASQYNNLFLVRILFGAAFDTRIVPGEPLKGGECQEKEFIPTARRKKSREEALNQEIVVSGDWFRSCRCCRKHKRCVRYRHPTLAPCLAMIRY
ncbi:hypothetical protein TNCT_79041 [Trichonephila clavata]|uniref:Uncharacterized protein n=1 Tax=Trichonephila clavata TaxID=2740835 RepID=A0A8X6KE35_TRICU|nr:hypothetical protein TNCT_79041 [Trichonephila clavata]